MPRIYKVVYESDTGEVRGDCSVCGVYSFPDEDTAYHHFAQIDLKGRSVADIEAFEKLALTELEDVSVRAKEKRLKYRIDLAKIKSKLKDRKKEKRSVNIYGVSFEEDVPETAIVERKVNSK